MRRLRNACAINRDARSIRMSQNEIDIEAVQGEINACHLDLPCN